MKWDCPHCRKDAAMRLVATRIWIDTGYDYKEEKEVKYYACVRCGKYSQRKFSRTTYQAVPDKVIEGLKI